MKSVIIGFIVLPFAVFAAAVCRGYAACGIEVLTPVLIPLLCIAFKSIKTTFKQIFKGDVNYD